MSRYFEESNMSNEEFLKQLLRLSQEYEREKSKRQAKQKNKETATDTKPPPPDEKMRHVPTQDELKVYENLLEKVLKGTQPNYKDLIKLLKKKPLKLNEIKAVTNEDIINIYIQRQNARQDIFKLYNESNMNASRQQTIYNNYKKEEHNKKIIEVMRTTENMIKNSPKNKFLYNC